MVNFRGGGDGRGGSKEEKERKLEEGQRKKAWEKAGKGQRRKGKERERGQEGK